MKRKYIYITGGVALVLFFLFKKEEKKSKDGFAFYKPLRFPIKPQRRTS